MLSETADELVSISPCTRLRWTLGSRRRQRNQFRANLGR